MWARPSYTLTCDVVDFRPERCARQCLNGSHFCQQKPDDGDVDLGCGYQCTLCNGQSGLQKIFCHVHIFIHVPTRTRAVRIGGKSGRCHCAVQSGSHVRKRSRCGSKLRESKRIFRASSKAGNMGITNLDF